MHVPNAANRPPAVSLVAENDTGHFLTWAQKACLLCSVFIFRLKKKKNTPQNTKNELPAAVIK